MITLYLGITCSVRSQREVPRDRVGTKALLPTVSLGITCSIRRQKEVPRDRVGTKAALLPTVSLGTLI